MNIYENKHKEEVDRATQLWECGNITRENLEYIFPELKESSDEKIKHEIKVILANTDFSQFALDYTFADMITWLERQGKIALEAIKEENVDNTNKIKPKFNEGEWIVNNNSGDVYKVTEIKDDEYCIWPLDAEIMGYLRIIDVDNEYHLWTIQDAKDGDIIATENFIFIFKNIDDNGVHYYCHYEISKHEDDNQFGIALSQSLMGRIDNNISHYSPATKEQCNTLFTKMREAGFEWDETKKELKEIEKQGEQKPIIDGILTATNYDKMFQNCNVHKFKVGYWIVNNDTKDVFLIKSFNNRFCTLEDIKGNIISPCLPPCESESHLWSIADAKDGDVLCYKYEVFLYKYDIKDWKETSFGGMVYYCCYDGKRFITDSFYSLTEQDKIYIHPATREQRRQLEKAMADAGYTFDFEKKELKKIEKQSSQWNISDYRTWQYIVSDVLTKHDGIGQYLDDAFCKKIAEYMQENWSKKLSLE